MGLRQQLLVIGLLVLLLPWSAWQVLREMEQALRHWQAESAQVTAQVIADKMVEDAKLMISLDRMAQRTRAYSKVWLLPLSPQKPVLDGYLDSWSSALPCPIENSRPALRCYAMRSRDYAYLAIEVEDAQRDFYNPTLAAEAFDYVQIDTDSRSVKILSSAVGVATVFNTSSSDKYQLEHDVSAFWAEQEHGYVVELRLPLSWLEHGLALRAYDGQKLSRQPAAEAELIPVVAQDYDLIHLLEGMHTSHSRLRVLIDGRWTVADVGSLQNQSPVAESGMIGKLLHFALKPKLETLDTSINYGATIQRPDWLGTGIRWSRGAAQEKLTVVQPIDGYQEAGIYLVLEQNSRSLQTMANGSLAKLLSYLGAFALLLVLILFGYATYLSLRVRRLSQAVLAASDEQGKFKQAFKVSRARDEIGDLSRAHAELLKRLRGYTQYLERLSQQLAHELRTPLAIVGSSLDNLDQLQAMPSTAQPYIHRAQTGLRRLSAILHSMSSAARLEQSLSSYELQALDLSQVLPELRLIYRDLYPDTEIQLSESLPADLIILGNQELLAQMLDKLLANARDFAKPGTPIELRLSSRQGKVVLAIKNYGEVIPEAIADKLFEPLVSHRQASDETHHLGLGLYIVKIISDYFGAKVIAANDVSDASVTFFMTFDPYTRPETGS